VWQHFVVKSANLLKCATFLLLEAGREVHHPESTLVTGAEGEDVLA
jgi:hypothetical protein